MNYLAKTNLSGVETPKKVLWGVAPTGDICINYLPNIATLNNLRKKGSQIIVLIADFHGYWDSGKTNYEDIENRTDYYSRVFKERFGFSDDEIVKASDFYFSKEYISTLYRYSTLFPNNDLLSFAERTLKNYNGENDYSFGDALYVATQIIDIVFLDIDCVICGEDESGIYKLGLNILNRVTSKKYKFLYTRMIEGVLNQEMHSSDPADNKILLDDTLEEVELKLSKNPKLQRTVKEYILPLWGHHSKENISKNYAKLLYETYNT